MPRVAGLPELLTSRNTFGSGSFVSVFGNLVLGVEKLGNGTLTLAGMATWLAAPSVPAGTLRAGADSLQTDIDNNGTVDSLQTADGTYSHQSGRWAIVESQVTRG